MLFTPTVWRDIDPTQVGACSPHRQVPYSPSLNFAKHALINERRKK